jgi:CHAT domain-containing protein
MFIRRLVCAFLLLSIAAPALASPLDDMRSRDRRSKPDTELAAWTAFAIPILNDAQTPPDLRAEMHMRMAIALYHAKEYEKGWEEARSAEKHSSPNWPYAAELASYQSLLLTDLSRLDEAKKYGDKAAATIRGQGGEDSGAMALPYDSLAMLEYAKGDYIEAARLMCLSSERAQKHLPPTDSMVAASMMACGIFRYNLDDDDAWEIMRQAATLAYANLPRESTVVAMALNGSGGALMQLGRYAEAEEIFRREIDVERATYGEDDINVYYPLSLLARILELQGKLEESEAVFRQAADFIHRVGGEGSNPELRGNSWVNLGVVLEKRGDFAAALATQQMALAELKAHLKPEHESIPQAERHIARLLSVLGRNDEALPLGEATIPKLTAALGPHHRATIAARSDYARMLDRAGQTAQAFKVAEMAARSLEDRQLDLASKRSDMVSFSQVMTRGFSDFAYIALRAGKMEEAVRAAQLASLSELTLVNAELNARAEGNDEGLSALVDQLRKARSGQRALQTELAQAEGSGTGDPLAIGMKLRTQLADIAELNTKITTQFPRFAALGRPNPVSLGVIQSRMAPHQALIIPLSLPYRTATLAITSTDVFWEEGGGSNRDIAALVSRIRRSIDNARSAADPANAAFDSAAAFELHQAVFPGELKTKIAQKTEWLFPASGPISSIPPSLLISQSPGKRKSLAEHAWLIRDHAISVISDFSLPRTQSTSPAPIRFAGIGAPDLPEGDLPNLPKARAELTAISGALGETGNLVMAGKNANESAVKAFDFLPYSVVAFATHGLTSGERNGLSEPALVLTAPDLVSEVDDGLLTATEIAQMNIPADWVILSACNSGAGLNASAPSYSGLARAFRLAGARSFLLSHWPVRDDAAARLTVESVKGSARGLRKAEALRQATLALMQDSTVPGGAHPAIWAPFILIED